MSDIREIRIAVRLGIRAGKALVIAENALRDVGAVAVRNNFSTIVSLREAKRELNHLSSEISNLIRHLEVDDG